MSTISKTTFTFEVLHRTDQPLTDLEAALDEANEGHAVGNVTEQTTRAIDDQDVAFQLKRLGNDGEFFEDDLIEEVTETHACRHCGHGIGQDSHGTWVAPDAGTDVEFGDGMWRDICPDNEDFPNPPHEPDEEN